MGLTPTFKMVDVRAKLQEKAKLMQKAIIKLLSYLGEQCVVHAQSTNTYRDQTGNLRASIGYVIAYNGQVMKVSFGGRTATRQNAINGPLKGEQLARSLASEHLQGWCLVVVAGMNYALAVESRGLDVLSSAELLAKTELPKLVSQLKLDVASIR